MSSVTFAIGDVHGCFAKLKRLISACDAYAGARSARYVFLGDYIDRGPASREVIEFLIELQQSRPGAVICLRGNHEDMTVAAHEDDGNRPLWLNNGGAATLESYRSTGGVMPASHLDWLRALPLCHDDGLRFFVHAGVDLTRPLSEQSEDDLLWMREPFLTDSDTVDCGRLVVHGHTPMRGGQPDVRRHRINLDTAAVFGGPLTAAAFDDSGAKPLGFLTDRRSLAAWLGGMFRPA